MRNLSKKIESEITLSLLCWYYQSRLMKRSTHTLRTQCEQHLVEWFSGPKDLLISLRKVTGWLLTASSIIFMKQPPKTGKMSCVGKISISILTWLHQLPIFSTSGNLLRCDLQSAFTRTRKKKQSCLTWQHPGDCGQGVFKVAGRHSHQAVLPGNRCYPSASKGHHHRSHAKTASVTTDTS